MRTQLVLIASSLLIGGCSGSDRERAEIYAFRAKITTGAEGSDANVSLCWTVDGTETCRDLSGDGNDFEKGATATYEARPPKRIPETTPITRIRLKYSGGLGLDEWELAGVKVTAQLANDTSKVLCESSGLKLLLKPGGSYVCPLLTPIAADAGE